MPSDSRQLVSLRNCSLILDGHSILDEVSFELRSGERWALIGANGSGKTMFLKMLRGDVWPTPTGREQRIYNFAGIASEPAGNKHHIAYVGSERQDKYVRYGWNLTVTQVVTTGLFDEDIPLTQPTAAQRTRVARMMKRFGIWGLRDRKFLSLSYGQRRLTLVARVFVSNAKVLLLDEVFNGLDTRAKRKLRRALETPRERHAWIITSHRPEELPVNVTHVAHIADGKIRIGSRAELRRVRKSGPERIAAKTFVHPLIESRSTRAVRAANGADDWLVRISSADLYRDYRPVIKNLNWTIRRGEHWAVLGPNGSGKSTLLSMLYGDLHPALGGTIERQGVPTGTHISEWKKRVGWVSPELQADHYLAKSLEEIVISGRYSSVGLGEPPTNADRRAARRWLRFFGIDHLRERGPRQVSYGQMRMALIARAMVNEPELLLLDEPCTGLDGDVRRQVLQLLQALAQRHTQLIMAVHDAADIVPAVKNVLRIGPGLRATVRKRRES
ncbi:MAG TPA: ATP-binding cassette domain-containing protein [Steroidobacteraceae bacterium]